MEKAINEHIAWLYSQREEMCQLLQSWCEIPSGTDQLKGLEEICTALEKAFAPLGGSSERLALPPRAFIDRDGVVSNIPSGAALRIRKKRPNTISLLLVGHMDTVFSAEQHRPPKIVRDGVMQGAGAADMKGGLVIMLKALEALERSPWRKKISWEVLITPDEEKGSVGSRHLLLESAGQSDLALVFEPTYPDGTLVSGRKGSANIAVVAEGKASHVGRNFDPESNAITALARYITRIDQLNATMPGIILNVGTIHGGAGANIVAERAFCEVNLRGESALQINRALQSMRRAAAAREGRVVISIVELSCRPPKVFDEVSEKLFHALKHCGGDLNIEIAWKPSGGVCDGNLLASAGVPVIDTMGAVGGDLHTITEWVELASLPERAALAVCLMIAIASEALWLKPLKSKEGFDVTS